MMYDMSADSFPAKIDSESKKKQWPIVRNDSIKFVLEIGQVYNREGKNYYKSAIFIVDMLALRWLNERPSYWLKSYPSRSIADSFIFISFV